MIVEVSNTSKYYGNQKALDAVSFKIEKGEIVGLLGPNGAGKSTLMKILTGYLEASEGEVFVGDLNISTDLLQVQKRIGYLPEQNPLYQEMYVREYLQFVAAVHRVSKEAAEKALVKVGLLPEANKKIQQLSKGYQQRVGLAAAILHDPEVLVLDEPTTGLDPNQLIEIRALIKELGKNKIILFSTHILQEVEAVCNRVLIIKKGQIVKDEKMEELKKQQNQIIEVAFDFQIEKRFFNSLPNLLESNNIAGTTWQLTFNTKEDRSSAIFDFATSNGLKILQLNTKNKNLESLFTELTS
ncbi:gliding motility-associated ABC transporter ATP-binding subunit GldA [Flavicella sediminum]|uniref:gliding motility-associated ABC transporter ATP-binding subunit GldA n=1 Tax=Flavicella sediminum TaxID=2585141 RepID=UPI0011226B35|nr:gliding motility-associated ABC transporter ATP-binding subunit GldA [Flavicella sediminum]